MIRKFPLIRQMALLFVVICPAAAQAQALADRLPPNAMIYAGWTGVEKPAPGFDGSHLQAVLNDSNLPQVFSDFIPGVLDRIAREDREAAQGIALFRALAGPMWRHPSAFGFMGVDMGNAGPMPKLILLSQAGAEAPALKRQLEDLLKQAGQLPFPAAVIQIEDLVAVVVGYEKPDAAIPAAGGKSLANDPNFVKTQGEVGKDAVMAVYVDFDGVFKLADMASEMASPEIKGNWIKARDQIGLASIKRMMWTAGFDGKEWGVQAFVAAPAPRTGLVASLMESDPLTEEVLRAIPKNVTVAGGFQFDLNGLVTALRTAVAAFDPDASKEVDQGMDKVNQVIGMDLQKDLLATFGTQWVYYIDPAVTGESSVGFTVVNRLKDPAKADESLKRLGRDFNQFVAQAMKKEHTPVTIAFRDAKVGGVDVHYLGLPLVAPAWAIEDGNLYIALYPEVVAAAANHVSRKGESLLENPDAMALWHRFGERPASSFGWVDLPRLAPKSYGSWLAVSHLAGAGDMFGVPAPLMILPPLSSLTPHLSPLAQMGWTDEQGAHFRGIEPFPGSGIFASDPMSLTAAQVPLLISILLPALNNARHEAAKVKSASNLRQIGIAIITYANDHQNALPPDLGTVMKEERLTLSVFVSPTGNNAPPAGLSAEDAATWVNQNGDYVLNPAAGKSYDKISNSDFPLVWERTGDGTGRNILFGDGHVQYFPGFSANQIIEKSQEKAQ